jgi:hypothetical protein
MQILTRLTGRGPNARFAGDCDLAPPSIGPTGPGSNDHAWIGTLALPIVHDLVSGLRARPPNPHGKPNHAMNKRRARVPALRAAARSSALSSGAPGARTRSGPRAEVSSLGGLSPFYWIFAATVALKMVSSGPAGHAIRPESRTS